MSTITKAVRRSAEEGHFSLDDLRAVVFHLPSLSSDYDRALAHMTTCEICRGMVEDERRENPLFALMGEGEDSELFWNTVANVVREQSASTSEQELTGSHEDLRVHARGQRTVFRSCHPQPLSVNVLEAWTRARSNSDHTHRWLEAMAAVGLHAVRTMRPMSALDTLLSGSFPSRIRFTPRVLEQVTHVRLEVLKAVAIASSSETCIEQMRRSLLGRAPARFVAKDCRDVSECLEGNVSVQTLVVDASLPRLFDIHLPMFPACGLVVVGDVAAQRQCELKFGEYPRYVFVSSPFDTYELVQAAARTAAPTDESCP